MEPGVNRVIREPAVMLPLLGADMSLGKAWEDCVSFYYFFPRSSVFRRIFYLYWKSRIA